MSAAAALVIALAPGQLALASCIQQTVREQADRAEVIAYGWVIPEGPVGGPPARFVLFRVERVLKGTIRERAGVALGPDVSPGPAGTVGATSVDYVARRDEHHTLYLRRQGDHFATDACAGSHAGPPTAEEIAMFGPGTPPDPAPTGIGGASTGDRIAAGIATVVALAAGAAAIWYARRSVRPVSG